MTGSFVPNQVTIPEGFSGSAKWQSPSNIALVKYWGKKGDQIPANPSISFTLDNCHTKTSVRYKKSTQATKRFFFEGKEDPAFGKKTFTFFEKIKEYAPWLVELEMDIETENSFPHSSGIASSASGMSAMALCVMQIEKQLNPDMTEEYFRQKASFLARIGSGSAARSVYGGLVVWGEQEGYEASSDLYAVSFGENVHEVYNSFHDVVLLVDKGQKQVSSTIGHGLMHSNPFSELRFEEARKNMLKLKETLQSGDVNEFGRIVEQEALMLHALMMTSEPYFILFRPNTVEIIQQIWEFRKETETPIFFTLDAGANVHVLFPYHVKDACKKFIQDKLASYCENGHFIEDQVGNGAKPF